MHPAVYLHSDLCWFASVVPAVADVGFAGLLIGGVFFGDLDGFGGAFAAEEELDVAAVDQRAAADARGGGVGGRARDREE